MAAATNNGVRLQYNPNMVTTTKTNALKTELSTTSQPILSAENDIVQLISKARRLHLIWHSREQWNLTVYQ